ncbi:MAG: tRNA preQ1(34) S-adenosylmethionine ribosyltransferase-isomerase QueA [Planctomycetota bacterium]|nr:tRNA preQ1(34) S-adenosylmethionine ribosyltransferase-isomerase QueA [Planctomycetota bacterium]
MDLSLLHYDLPREAIAQSPSPERDGSRLLVVPREGGGMSHGRFRDISGQLRPGDLLVINKTRVVPARLLGRRESGGKVEVLLLRRDGEIWQALGKTRGSLRAGERLAFDGIGGRFEGKSPGGEWRITLDAELEKIRSIGAPPLPPYIRRPEGLLPEDPGRYQTVYAEEDGSVAAPTAGLHFTRPLLERLTSMGIEVAALTLHIGPGTFRPIRSDSVEAHKMQAESYSIPDETIEAIRVARQERRRVIAVGTSTTRAIESHARTGISRGETDLFIHPPFEFLTTGGLLTNFHLPGSTLLCLVAAFAGRERILSAYHQALEAGYRFYSYGDAMLII